MPLEMISSNLFLAFFLKVNTSRSISLSNFSSQQTRENLFAVWSELCLFRGFFFLNSCFRLRFWYIFLYVLYLISFCFETVLCVPSTNKCSPRNSVWERLLLRPSEWWLIDRKMTILMCRSELPNSKLRKVVRFFVFVLFVCLFFFSQNCFLIPENSRKQKRASVAVKWRNSVLRVGASELFSWKAQKRVSSFKFDWFVSEGLNMF